MQLSSERLIGRVLQDRYRVVDVLARGGMGCVYRAEQLALGRLVAVKTIDRQAPTDEFRARFLREAELASQLTHPNTVRIFDYGATEDGILFLVMELLTGESLSSLLKREAPLDAARAAALLRPVCGALHESHELGLVHRDIKPGNLFVTRPDPHTEVLRVLDFGLVKAVDDHDELSQTGQAVGSPLYMSPEQAAADPVDRRTDIYSLGVVLYTMLNGVAPFRGGSSATMLLLKMSNDLPPLPRGLEAPAVPESIAIAAERCGRLDREQRWPDMMALATALGAVDAHRSGDIDPTFVDPSTETLVPEVSISRSGSGVLTGAALGASGMGVLVTAAMAVLLGVLLLAGAGLSMSWAPATVRVDSLPPEATIWRDGDVLGTAPLDIRVERGAAFPVVTLSKQGYGPVAMLLDPDVGRVQVRLSQSRTSKAASSVRVEDDQLAHMLFTEAMALTRAERHQEALERAQRVLAISDRRDTLLLIAHLHGHLGEHDRAIGALERLRATADDAETQATLDARIERVRAAMAESTPTPPSVP